MLSIITVIALVFMVVYFCKVCENPKNQYHHDDNN